MTKIKHETRKVLLADLKAFPNNPNIHPEDQIKALAQSIEKYGQYYPIIVDEEMQILCGHGKKLGLEYNGETEAEVRVMIGLDHKDKMRLVIEDNKIQSMSYINFSKVEDIIKEIGVPDIIGYSQNYLEAIINEVSPDNMGVDFAKPAVQEQTFSEEKSQVQRDDVAALEEGLQTARTMVCPHCSKEIVL